MNRTTCLKFVWLVCFRYANLYLHFTCIVLLYIYDALYCFVLYLLCFVLFCLIFVMLCIVWSYICCKMLFATLCKL